MRLLLDSHTLLWWLAGDKQLSSKARRLIADEEGLVYVSAASAWEIATKYRIGRLPGAQVVATDFVRHVALQGFIPLDITLDHGQRAGALPGEHRDPFDRMLIAQALAENLTVVSVDSVFDEYRVPRVW